MEVAESLANAPEEINNIVAIFVSPTSHTDLFYRFYYENHDDDFSKARVQLWNM